MFSRGENSQSHGVNDELHDQELSVGGDTVGVKVGAGAVVLAVLVNQVPHDLVEHGGPGLANVVDLVLGVEGGVGVGVGGQAGREEDGADAGRVVVHPGAHGVVGVARVLGLEADGGGHEVTPTLTHTAGLESVQAVGVGGSTGQTGRETVRVLVDDDTGLEGAVTVGGGLGPDVHSHASGRAIGGSGKVGIVGAGAVLGVEDGEIAAGASLALVADLEVTGLLVESEGVEEIVVLVAGEEELSDRGVAVGRGGSGRGGPVVLELVGGAGGTVVVQVGVATSGVGLSNGVVTTGGVVGAGTVAEPGERRLGGVPGVGQGLAVALIGVVASPGEDEVAGLGDVVDNTVDDVVGLGVNVSQQPVVEDIGLDSPGESQGTVVLDVVHEASLGVRLSTSGASELVGLGTLNGLGGSLASDGQSQDAGSSVQGIDGVGEPTLAQGALGGNLSGVKVVTVGEDVAILANVDVESGVVNVKAVDSLLEVDVADAVGANVAVGHTELDVGQNALDQLSSGLDKVGTLQDLERGIVHVLSAGLVDSVGLSTELVEIDGALVQAGLVGVPVVALVRVGKRQRRANDEAGQQRVAHLGQKDRDCEG